MAHSFLYVGISLTLKVSLSLGHTINIEMNLQRGSLLKTTAALFILPLAIACIGCGGRHKGKSDSAKNEENNEGVMASERKVNNHPLDLKLYMERSGSMVSFDSESSKGEFKGIVSTLLNRFPQVQRNDSTYVYIVNDNIYPYEGTVKEFLAQRDFFSSTKDIGNPSYTDFDRIFEMIITDTKKYQVSALVTDMIYSVKGQETVTASKLLNEAYALTHNVFKGKTKTSVIVLKFEADYDGTYYPYNSPSGGVQYNGNRPFYVMLFASKDTMEELYYSEEYSTFINFSTLPSFENMFCFTSMCFTPSYTILLDYDHEGRYRKDKEKIRDGKLDSKFVKAISNVQLSKDGSITIPIALDLSHIPLSNSYKKNEDYYEIESKGGFEVKSIKSIEELDSNEISTVKESLPTATHLLTLKSEARPLNETVKIKMLYKLPDWISKSSSRDDSNVSADNFSSTTFGFEEVMKGMYGAYVPDGASHFIFEIDFSIKKK